MKKISWLISLVSTLALASCEMTQEITINKDGSGSLNNTSDMSSLVGMMKTMGGDSMTKMSNTDTTISLAGIADSIQGLTAQQKKIINQGRMKLTLNMKDEKLVTKASFPFEKLTDLQMLNAAMPKVSEAMSKKLTSGEQMPAGLPISDKMQIRSFDDFFDVTISNNVLSKSLDKAKYATVPNDEYMKSIQQLSSMGSPITANYVINLPRPAKKTEGKALKLSDDKKKVTITVSSDDFFDNPDKFEYRIEF